MSKENNKARLVIAVKEKVLGEYEAWHVILAKEKKST